jgi:uncharacterized protein GlcG (DUF336 family)
MKHAKWLAASALLAAGAASAQQAVVTERTLSLDAAIVAAQAALETCRKNGHNVTVTVLNRSARIKAQLHDDKANPHTLENSFRKAYTSITYRGGAPSGEFGQAMAKSPPPHSLLLLQNMTAAEGALPIKVGNELVGSIGVSGAPGGDKDAVCAQAGIDRIKGALGG